MNPVVIMPSIRQPNRDYLEPLGDTPVIVIDDSNGNIPKNLAPHITVLDYSDRDKIMGDKAWLIPEKNPSCKNLGLYWAWKEGFDTLILLDDDCDCRVSPNFLDEIPIGRFGVYNSIETNSPWVNSMRCLGEDKIWARGYPYEYRHLEEKWGHPQIVCSMFNEGLWTGTADINGIDKLNGTVATAERKVIQNAFVPVEKKLPLSIMNVQLHRDLVPAFYQPPDYFYGGGFRIRRHDDVWSMMFLKTLMDLKGDTVTVGGPIVWHRKEGNMYQEILGEHGANLIQRDLEMMIQDGINYLDIFGKSFNELSYAQCAISLAESMGPVVSQGSFYDILADYRQRIRAWAELFE